MPGGAHDVGEVGTPCLELFIAIKDPWTKVIGSGSDCDRRCAPGGCGGQSCAVACRTSVVHSLSAFASLMEKSMNLSAQRRRARVSIPITYCDDDSLVTTSTRNTKAAAKAGLIYTRKGYTPNHPLIVHVTSSVERNTDRDALFTQEVVVGLYGWSEGTQEKEKGGHVRR